MKNQPLLSILIATMPSRKTVFAQLTAKVFMQMSSQGFHKVEGLYDDRMDITIGFKRNEMLKRARGKFVVFIDDDDDISFDYVERILQTIELNPDVDAIGMRGKVTLNGTVTKNWVISKSCKRWYEQNNVFYRTTNHISPVRREIALKVGFPDKSHGEDFEYSMALIPLLNSEAFIDADLYHYHFSEAKPKEPNQIIEQTSLNKPNEGFYRPAWR